MSFKKFGKSVGLATALLLQGTSGYDINYLENGADWKWKFPTCALPNQSPIDLKSSGWPIISYEADNFNGLFTNQRADEYGLIKIPWNGFKHEISCAKPGQDLQKFYSQYAVDILGISPIWTAHSFHFHHESEHTVDGERFDFEMHISFAASFVNEFQIPDGAVAILFDVKRYTAKLTDDQYEIIDNFFDSVGWDVMGDTEVDAVPFGDLMMMVDMSSRWVYKGSHGMPPCNRYIYYNVLNTIYPIKQKHLDLFYNQLKRGKNNLHETGNWREVNDLDLHNPSFITPEARGTGQGKWTYGTDLGLNWPSQFPQCGGPQQSPINLLSPISDYGQTYNVYDAAVDQVVGSYYDLETPQVKLDRKNQQVNIAVNNKLGYQGIESNIAATVFGTFKKWQATKIIFHAASEHTIDGQRFDVEMQVIHTPLIEEPENKKSAEKTNDNGKRNLATDKKDASDDAQSDYLMTTVAILFDAENYDPVTQEEQVIIEQFFKDLFLEVDDPIVETISFGKFMNSLDFDNRWMYKGTRTVPPCTGPALWQIPQRVLPIQKRWVEEFQKKMLKTGAERGNYRVIQTEFNPDIAFVSSFASKLKMAIITVAISLLYVAQ